MSLVKITDKDLQELKLLFSYLMVDEDPKSLAKGIPPRLRAFAKIITQVEKEFLLNFKD